MARLGLIRRDRQHLKKLIEECELEWNVLSKQVQHIDRVSMDPLDNIVASVEAVRDGNYCQRN